jgi:L-amino acid N-acyltransferase YncA
MTNFKIRRLVPSDSPSLLDIINHYALNSTADFSDKLHDLTDIKNLIETGEQFPKCIAEIDKEIVGFGLAYPFRSERTFSNTVKFTYWIKPAFTGKGLGAKFYDILESSCQKNGVKNILVNISSENLGSIKFHERRGFIHCGQFRQIGKKLDRHFDLIWLQKII